MKNLDEDLAFSAFPYNAKTVTSKLYQSWFVNIK
jgi:hypothetical protein